MRVAYFDCFSGASGDMIVGSLLDAGATLDNLRNQVATLAIDGHDIQSEKLTKQGFAATQFLVRSEVDQPHRHLKDVLSIIHSGKLSQRVTELSSQIFSRLAEAEASVHGTSIESVHFHEVGAIDAIIDIVGCCLALEELDIEEVYASSIPTGSGTVHCAHGVLPVPAPATAKLLEGVEICSTEETGELTTPTGAAILTTVCKRFGSIPPMTLLCSGIGAGQREGKFRPNILRVLLGEIQETGDSDQIAVLEANIDDQSPEVLAYTIEKLIARGALDAYCQPIYMKKGRVGLLLTVLCACERVEEMTSIIFTETSTFGLRKRISERSKLARRFEQVELSGQVIRIKIGSHQGQDCSVSPEYDDCVQVAHIINRPLKDVMSQALQIWYQRNRE